MCTEWNNKHSAHVSQMRLGRAKKIKKIQTMVQAKRAFHKLGICGRSTIDMVKICLMAFLPSITSWQIRQVFRRLEGQHSLELLEGASKTVAALGYREFESPLPSLQSSSYPSDSVFIRIPLSMLCSSYVMSSRCYSIITIASVEFESNGVGLRNGRCSFL